MAPTSSASSSAHPLPKSFSSPQAKKAVDALLTHARKAAKEREDTELIVREEHVWLCINTKSGTVKRKMMPVRIQLPHPPIAPPPATSVCLITKDPQREYKDLLSAKGVKFVSRVVGVEKLKGKFKPFEARRSLMQDHEIWLCDDRVLPLMPKLLGKMFFDAKKKPIPVNLKRKDLKAELARAINSTYFHPGTGTSQYVYIPLLPILDVSEESAVLSDSSVKVSNVTTNTPSQTLDNLLAALPAAVAQLPGGWESVLNIGIKSDTSVLLPIYSSALKGRFANADGDAEEVEMDEEEVVEPLKATKTAASTVKPKSILKATNAEAPRKKTSSLSKNATGKSKSAIIGTSRR